MKFPELDDNTLETSRSHPKNHSAGVYAHQNSREISSCSIPTLLKYSSLQERADSYQEQMWVVTLVRNGLDMPSTVQILEILEHQQWMETNNTAITLFSFNSVCYFLFSVPLFWPLRMFNLHCLI